MPASSQDGSRPSLCPRFGWLARFAARRRIRRAGRRETAAMREWTRRWVSGESICTMCGGPLAVPRIHVVSGVSLEIVSVCRACEGPSPVVLIDWARCPLCGKKDMERRITASIGLSTETIRTLARFISRVCPTCERAAQP